jgi:hypothetical protein
MKRVVVVNSTLAASDGWFDALDKKKQDAYIKAHPNSKYAKNAAKSKPRVSDMSPADKSKLVTGLNAKQKKNMGSLVKALPPAKNLMKNIEKQQELLKPQNGAAKFKPTMGMQTLGTRFKYTNPKEKDQDLCKVTWTTTQMNGCTKSGKLHVNNPEYGFYTFNARYLKQVKEETNAYS